MLIDDFKLSGITFNWCTVYVGLNMNLVSNIDISNYSICYLTEHTENQNSDIIDLACGNIQYTKDEIKIMLEKIIEEEKILFSQSVLEKEKNKWLYYLLKKIRNTYKDHKKILIEVENIYATFDYPAEMEEFISYMPCKSNYLKEFSVKERSVEENMSLLVDKLDKYLEEKYKIITMDAFS